MIRCCDVFLTNSRLQRTIAVTRVWHFMMSSKRLEWHLSHCRWWRSSGVKTDYQQHTTACNRLYYGSHAGFQLSRPTSLLSLSFLEEHSHITNTVHDLEASSPYLSRSSSTVSSPSPMFSSTCSLVVLKYMRAWGSTLMTGDTVREKIPRCAYTPSPFPVHNS